MPRAFHLSAVLVALLAVQAVPAHAQLNGQPFEQGMRSPDSLLDGSAHERHTQISAYGVYSYLVGAGAAARYSLPVFKDGFIPELNDSIELEIGADFLFGFFGLSPSVVVGALEPKWSFHFTPQFDGYVKLGLGLFLWLGTTNSSPVYLLATGGLAYKLFPNFWLRLEGSNLGASLGVGLDF